MASDGKQVDFMIHGLFSFSLFGQEIWITTSHVSLLIIILLLIVFAWAARRRMMRAEPVPGAFQNVVEWIVEMIDRMIAGIMGDCEEWFRNYIGAVFLFLLTSNLSGLFGIRPPTADFGVTLGLGLSSFALIQYFNIRHNRGRAFTDLFRPLPVLFPINLIGEVATPLSLSLRLFGNVLSGTVMMALVYGLMPIFLKLGFPAVLHVYFDVFSGCIQAYVFCMLTMVFTRQKMKEE